MINEAHLLDAGYRSFDRSITPMSVCLWQKAVFSEDGAKRYFIDVDVFDMREVKKRGYRGPDRALQFSLRVTRQNGTALAIDMSFDKDRDLASVEAEVEDLFRLLGCTNYEV